MPITRKTQKTKKDAASRPEKVTVLVYDADLLRRVDEWGQANRRRNRSNAIECLVALALDAADAQAKQATA